MPKLLSRAKFATLVGIGKPGVTRLMKGRLADAASGVYVDIDHPCVVDYMESRNSSGAEDPAEGVDELYEEAIKLCRKSARWSIKHIRDSFKIGSPRATKIANLMKVAGVWEKTEKPKRQAATTKKKVIRRKKEPVEKPKPKKAEQPDVSDIIQNVSCQKSDAEERGIPHGFMTDLDAVDLPEDITSFYEMTLARIIEIFGTETKFDQWLGATKTIEDINAKRLKNAESEGKLVSIDLIKRFVFDPINKCHRNLLSDGAKSIAVKVHSMCKAGASQDEVELYISKRMTKFIRPMKAQISRKLKEEE